MTQSIKDKIKAFKHYIFLQEQSNDTYYLSPQYLEDYQHLNHLYQLQKQEQQNK